MRIINFYPRSRNVKPHISEDGQVHVCISDWWQVLDYRNRPTGDLLWRLENQTNGTSQPSQ